MAASSAAHDAALAFLYDRIDYERALSLPYSARTLKLERMRELLARLGNPQRALPTVHIAGTKGKGSTAAMVAAVLTAAGHRTGLASSPHLHRVEERMAVDGRPASGDELVELVDELRPHVAEMERQAAHTAGDTGPTYFEITTALAWQHFARHRVRAAVVEVGLGGRLDATNVCDPVVTAITSISYDHTRQLGNTLAEIAGEKAGIVKPGVPLVSGATQAEPHERIAAIASERGSRLAVLGRDFDFVYEPARGLERASALARIDYRSTIAGQNFDRQRLGLAMIGRHQGANAAVALAILDELSLQGWHLPEAAVRHGLATATCPARVEVIGRQPAIVLDAAHNVASVAALRATLDESFAAARRILV
ncbi:MAG: folylpolyglutamate synthase/dihydrofolate synthase family protein, partial [Pirellulales bacterium]